MGKRHRSGRLRTAHTAKAKHVPKPSPPKKSWWQSIGRLAGKKVLVLVGLILTVLVTTAVTAFANANFWPWYRAATGQTPFAAQAFEQWSPSDTVDRVIPPGENSVLKTLLASGTANAQSAGIAVGTLKAHLVVQAEDSTVTIIGIRLVAHRLKPISNGTLIFAGTQGAGTVIQLYFDADSADAVGKDNDGYDYFANSYVTLQPGEATEFELQVTAKVYYSQFSFMITVFSDGRLSEVPVTYEGHPFLIAPPSKQYDAVYTVPVTSPNRQWVRESPGLFCRQNLGVCAG